MIRLALILFVAGLVSACDTTETETVEILIPRPVSSGGYTETESGLRYHDFRAGNGAVATDSSLVTVHLAAWLTNQTLISSTFDSDEPVSLDMQSETVVPGLAEGILGMRVGGERGLLVPPDLAFGDEGVPQAGIPGGATIIYEIELVSVDSL